MIPPSHFTDTAANGWKWMRACRPCNMVHWSSIYFERKARRNPTNEATKLNKGTGKTTYSEGRWNDWKNDDVITCWRSSTWQLTTYIAIVFCFPFANCYYGSHSGKRGISWGHCQWIHHSHSNACRNFLQEMLDSL